MLELLLRDRKNSYNSNSPSFKTTASTDGTWEIIKDIGSGANYRNYGLLRLLDLICHHRLKRLVIIYRASLSHLGSELIFKLCEIFQVEIIILNSLEAADSEAEWQEDIPEIFEQLNAQLKALLNEAIIQQRKKRAD